MVCKNCGAECGNAKFCPNCGTDLRVWQEGSQSEQNCQYDQYRQNGNQQDYYYGQYDQNQQKNQQDCRYGQDPYWQNPYSPYGMRLKINNGRGFAIASMVLGILSLLSYSFVMGVLGIVFGGVAKSKGTRSAMATAGIVCGILGIAFWICMMIFEFSLGLTW